MTANEINNSSLINKHQVNPSFQMESMPVESKTNVPTISFNTLHDLALRMEVPLTLRPVVAELPHVELAIRKTQLPVALLQVMRQLTYITQQLPSYCVQYNS